MHSRRGGGLWRQRVLSPPPSGKKKMLAPPGQISDYLKFKVHIVPTDQVDGSIEIHH